MSVIGGQGGEIAESGGLWEVQGERQNLLYNLRPQLYTRC